MSHQQVISRIIVLIVACPLIASVQGSCLSYGHSCWGAHGKRSSGEEVNYDNWLITKILNGRDRASMPALKSRQLPAPLPPPIPLLAQYEKPSPEEAWAGFPNKINLQALQWLTKAHIPIRFNDDTSKNEVLQPVPNSTEQEYSADGARIAPFSDQDVVFVEKSPKLIKILGQP